MQEATKSAIRNYLLTEFLHGDDPSELEDSTSLVNGGVLDSLATLKLVAFLEEQFQIVVEPHEVTADNLDTISDITRLVLSKLSAAAH